jgi:nucleotide-binding universal stress UspA family protein
LKRFKNILYFADNPDTRRVTLERAAALAKTNDARLTVMDVTEEAEEAKEIEKRFGIDLNAALRERRLEQLEALTAPHTEAGVMIYTQVLTGLPFIEVIRDVQRNGYDLLMKVAQPSGRLADRLFSSSDMHLLRKCPCPVWIDRPDCALPYKSILAAVDPASQSSERLNRLIMDLASSLAERERARLHVVHVWRLKGESRLSSGYRRIAETELRLLLNESERRHREGLNRLLNDYGMAAGDENAHLLKGDAAEIIAGLARELSTDLIVMGTVGRSGVSGLLIGNTAEDVLLTTHASVLTVKPENFVSPIALP